MNNYSPTLITKFFHPDLKFKMLKKVSNLFEFVEP